MYDVGQTTWAWTQGGSAGTPVPLLAWKVQPSDAAKAYFGAYFPYYVNTPIGSTVVDSIMSFGYNPDLVSDDVSITVNFEQDYENALGVHIIEHYAQYVGKAPNRVELRPWYYNVNKDTNVGHFQLTLAGVGRTGVFRFLSGDQTACYYTLTDAGFVWKNNYRVRVLDGNGNEHDVFWMDTGANGGDLVFGSFDNNMTIVRGGHGGGFPSSYGAQVQTNGRFGIAREDGTVFFDVDNLHGGAVTIAVASYVSQPPARGFTVYIDPADGALKCISAAGRITILAQA